MFRFKENTTIPKEIASLVKRHPTAVTEIPDAVNVSISYLHFTSILMQVYYGRFSL